MYIVWSRLYMLYTLDFDKKFFALRHVYRVRAFVFFSVSFLSWHSKPARELASHHVVSNEGGRASKHEPGVSISFVNQESSVYSYGRGVDIGSQGGIDIGVFLPSSLGSLSESAPLQSGIHPRIKRAAISATFPFSLSSRPAPHGLRNEGVRKEARRWGKRTKEWNKVDITG